VSTTNSYNAIKQFFTTPYTPPDNEVVIAEKDGKFYKASRAEPSNLDIAFDRTFKNTRRIILDVSLIGFKTIGVAIAGPIYTYRMFIGELCRYSSGDDEYRHPYTKLNYLPETYILGHKMRYVMGPIGDAEWFPRFPLVKK
jgi:hypothetical protein